MTVDRGRSSRRIDESPDPDRIEQLPSKVRSCSLRKGPAIVGVRIENRCEAFRSVFVKGTLPLVSTDAVPFQFRLKQDRLAGIRVMIVSVEASQYETVSACFQDADQGIPNFEMYLGSAAELNCKPFKLCGQRGDRNGYDVERNTEVPSYYFSSLAIFGSVAFKLVGDRVKRLASFLSRYCYGHTVDAT